MKNKNEVTRVLVYRDEKYEIAVKNDLQVAQKALAAVLDVWNGLELIPCTDIFALILNPETAYKKAVNELAVVPVTVGRFQLSKEVYISTLETPIPDSLYRAAREARKVPYCQNPELWSIESDKVVLNETEANYLIDSQSIYVSTPEQKKFADDILTYIQLTNELSKKIDLPLSQSAGHAFYRGIFSVTQKTMTDPFELAIIPNKLREWLR